ncbi:MAG: hypothetical protein R3C18_04260 [Planctomycetaceae bacterium]
MFEQINFLPILAEDGPNWIMPIIGLFVLGMAVWDFVAGRAAIGKYGSFVFSRDENPVMFFIIIAFKVGLGIFLTVLGFVSTGG